MCKELDDELAAGKEMAIVLARHLRYMGASSCMIPVSVDGREYEVLK